MIESLLLMTLAAATGRSWFIDVGLTLALLAFGGGLVFVRLLGGTVKRNSLAARSAARLSELDR